MDTTTDGRCLILGMGDGTLTTLSIADPLKDGAVAALQTLPSRRSQPEPGGAAPGTDGAALKTDGSAPGTDGSAPEPETEEYLQNGAVYPQPHQFSIYTDYLRALHTVIPE